MTPSKSRPQTRRKAAAKDESQVLLRAILNLPTRLRDVFLLNRMVGMTSPEIGLHLGMTPKAVETSLAAALVRLMRPPQERSIFRKSDDEVMPIVARPTQK
jgi:DNA-directed RNA polymerase specialized sigma24 family protein